MSKKLRKALAGLVVLVSLATVIAASPAAADEYKEDSAWGGVIYISDRSNGISGFSCGTRCDINPNIRGAADYKYLRVRVHCDWQRDYYSGWIAEADLRNTSFLTGCDHGAKRVDISVSTRKGFCRWWHRRCEDSTSVHRL